jgi:hypothetical protein
MLVDWVRSRSMLVSVIPSRSMLVVPSMLNGGFLVR